jgi:ATP-dependent DNA ligase
MPYLDQGHPLAIARRRFQNRIPQNPYGIVRHSTLWVRQELVAEVEFVEWTPEGHLRHARFVSAKDG